MPEDVTTLTARLPTVAAIVFAAGSLVASTTVLAGKIEAVAVSVASVRAEQAATKAELTRQLDALSVRSQEQERLIVELSTTLRVKGILR